MPDSAASPFDAPPNGAPNLDGVTQVFRDLCVTIAWLRDPEKGCPWDLKQTHASLRRFMIEEAYEATETMTDPPAPTLRDELGDVLLQVVLNAQVALDRGDFGLEDVIRSINAKMRRRHPHVFASGEREKGAISETSLRQSWNEIKADEKKAASTTLAKEGIFAKASGKHPATHQAGEIGKIAATIDFDWTSPLEVLNQVQSEVDELHEEFQRPKLDPQLIAAEIGDVYFSLAQLCRHLGLDPEIVSLDANQKFLRRFEKVEKLAHSSGVDVRTAGRDALEKLWSRAKDAEKG